MAKAKSALLGGIIDYAGLFPPAKLPMEESIRNYVDFVQGEAAWIVNRFVCPTVRLEELGTALDALGTDRMMPISVVGKGGTDLGTFERHLESDAKQMTEFEARWGGKAALEAFETRVPVGEEMPRALSDLAAFSSIDVFAEIPLDAGVPECMAVLAESAGLFAKGRTGGTESGAFPTSIDLAAFLAAAVDLDVGFKLTAGLHQPFRHYDPALAVHHHGFLNVCAALLLRDVENASTRELKDALDCADAAEFELSEDAFQFREQRFGLDAIQEIRQLFAGFGSCSVAEPLDGLASWLSAGVVR